MIMTSCFSVQIRRHRNALLAQFIASSNFGASRSSDSILKRMFHLRFQHPRGVKYQTYPFTILITDMELKCNDSASRDGREEVITR